MGGVDYNQTELAPMGDADCAPAETELAAVGDTEAEGRAVGDTEPVGVRDDTEPVTGHPSNLGPTASHQFCGSADPVLASCTVRSASRRWVPGARRSSVCHRLAD